MGFVRCLCHRLLFGSSPVTQPRPAARPPAAPAHPAAASAAAGADDITTTIREWIKPHPPRCVYRSRQELELALLLAWIPDVERRRFLDLLLPKAGRHAPWAFDDVDGEPRQQGQRCDEPLVIQQPKTMTTEGFCAAGPAISRQDAGATKRPAQRMMRVPSEHQ